MRTSPTGYKQLTEQCGHHAVIFRSLRASSFDQGSTSRFRASALTTGEQDAYKTPPWMVLEWSILPCTPPACMTVAYRRNGSLTKQHGRPCCQKCSLHKNVPLPQMHHFACASAVTRRRVTLSRTMRPQPFLRSLNRHLCVRHEANLPSQKLFTAKPSPSIMLPQVQCCA